MATTPARQDNVTTDVENRSLHKVALKVNRAGERLWRAAPGVKSTVRALYYRVNARADQDRLDPAHREWLTDYFAADVAALRALMADDAATAMPPWLEARSMGCPDFVIAGAMRAATTALAAALGPHTPIFMATPKEPNFFAAACGGLTFCGPGDQGFARTNITQWDTYQGAVPRRRARVRGEASAAYLSLPGVAPEIRHG